LKTTLPISVEPIEPDFSDFSLCSGDVAPILSPVSPNGITGTWNPTTVDNMVSGPYIFTPDSGQPCTPTNKTINVTVNPSNTIVNLNWTVTDAFTKNQIVTVINPVGLNYVYQMDSGPFQISPVFENVASGLHSITVNDVNGCSALTDTNVLVIGSPKFFTPNGDGYNDIWNITSLSDQLNTRIYIFDRYGKLLKDISPNGSGWDGTYIGQPMPADDYWFTVEYSEQNSIKKYKSHFSLKR
jgi:gliding motility-associated-like protein